MVLTVQAAEVASCARNGETGRAGMEMIEGLLLHGVDGQGAGLGIHLAYKLAAKVPAATAQPRLAIGNMAMMRTKLTHYGAIVQSLVVSALMLSHIS